MFHLFIHIKLNLFQCCLAAKVVVAPLSGRQAAQVVDGRQAAQAVAVAGIDDQMKLKTLPTMHMHTKPIKTTYCITLFCRIIQSSTVPI